MPSVVPTAVHRSLRTREPSRETAVERQSVAQPGNFERALHRGRPFDDQQLAPVRARGRVGLDHDVQPRGIQERHATQIEDHALEAGSDEPVDLGADAAGGGDVDVADRAHAHRLPLGVDVKPERRRKLTMTGGGGLGAVARSNPCAASISDLSDVRIRYCPDPARRSSRSGPENRVLASRDAPLGPRKREREAGSVMRETQQRSDATAMQAVSNALVRLHKEQFGRGPTNARSNFAGPDTLVCVMEDALLPAERTMVEMGEQQRIRESRTFLQVATQDEFVKTVEAIISRKVRAFASAIDPDPDVVFEVFSLVPETTSGDGSKPA